jgi:hypothetical protein
VKTIEASPPEEYRRIHYGASEKYFDDEISLSSQGTDPQTKFNRSWGYLPPLDDEALSIINAIIANPDMGKEFANIRPDHKDFSTGLEDRNVFLKETAARDPQADHINSLASGEPFLETDKEKQFHDELWTLDQAKCDEVSNEAVFQRTVMMNLITRHRLIYNGCANYPHVLDFSVEEPWSCYPMPTRAYWKKEGGYLTQPKPDLAVCFRREALIPERLWKDMPMSIKCLACYENTNDSGKTRVFHFFAIEAKKATISINDNIGKRQSLNNASQALHNMYEFFKDAGPNHEEEFFTKVRFFSVVASTEGLNIRIHRATREPAEGNGRVGLIMKERPDYPLRFEYQDFISIQRDLFNRNRVFEVFEKILIGYGANELYLLLRNAAKAIMEKLANDPVQMRLRSNPDFYRYGQTDINIRSRRQTPAASLALSTRSVQMWDPTEAPARSRTQTPVQALGTRKKRTREQSTDDNPAKRTYQRKKPTNT